MDQDPKDDAQVPKDGTDAPSLSPPSTPMAFIPARSGFLVLKLQEGEGILLLPDIEIRLKSSRNSRAVLAIHAPKDRPIRRVPADGT